MRLWAADGTGFRLPDEEWLGEEFGWHGNQHNRVPSCRLLAYYDLLNQTHSLPNSIPGTWLKQWLWNGMEWI